MPTSVREPLLAIRELSAGYGKIGVLKSVDMVVYPGEIVAMLGPNGAGKTTLLRAISGLLPWSGQITFGGRSLVHAGPRDAVNQGLVHVVEGHRVFTQITVEDNVLLAGYGLPAAQRRKQIEEALDFFPEIKAKRNDKAVTLSGGQQQMLAVAQGLVRKPRLLMLDEPSAGLSPVLVDRVLAAARQLRAAGTAVLLVEQLIEKSLAVADRVYALARGKMVLEASAGQPGLPQQLERVYFGEEGLHGAAATIERAPHSTASPGPQG
jgi:branched-chain amino acid transport system ATP-binding protein